MVGYIKDVLDLIGINNGVDISSALPLLLKQATDIEVDAFIPLMNGCPPIYNRNKSWRLFGKTMPHFQIRGTTYSGHPTRTTLGNTLWSITYYTYLCSKLNIEPKLIAAGDDVCIWVPRAEADRVVSYIKSMTSQTNEPGIVGIGQIVKDMTVREWWNIDFCSKNSFHVGNTNSYFGWYLTRDVKKALTTRHYLIPKHI